MKVITEKLRNCTECFNACNFIILEKSDFLINHQKKNINYEKISWINDVKNIKPYPTLIIENEFYDTLPIKKLFKKKEVWYEKLEE